MKRSPIFIALLGSFALLSTIAALLQQEDVDAATGRAKLRSVVVRDIPHVQQKPDFCGEACAEMALRSMGYRFDQDAVFNHARLSPLEGRGCYTRELRTALDSIGLATGPVWHRVGAARVTAELDRLWKLVHTDLQAGVPSIVCTRFDDRPTTTEHFRLITGYDADTDEILYHEPAQADGAYRRMARETFLKLWPLKYKEDVWTVIRLRLKPEKIANPAPAESFTDADYAQHMMRLKKKLPSKQFHVALEKPFFVVGDESRQTVERRAAGTIRWAIQKLKKDYFARDPNQIIDIWLFKDKESYERHTKLIFNDTPSTPFGYYSPTHRALIMNISTGGGTLVHEIVHPFVASNFAQCPAWFNEGLASLYEQCGEVDGKIHGYTNWRLAGLQRAVRKDAVPSFQDLCSTTTREFYHDPGGTNYGQARYLCYYLQDIGKLREFYHGFRKNADQDSTGLTTLATVLNERDLDRFKKQWEAYVLKLRFR